MKTYCYVLLLMIAGLTIKSANAENTNLGDTLGAFNAGILTPSLDKNLMGIVFVDGHYYISGAQGQNGWHKKIYKISADGQQLVDYWDMSDQLPTVGLIMGLAYDGEYLYATTLDTIRQIDIQTMEITGFTIQSPIYYTSGLAYDPNNDSFWVSGSGTQIYEINRAGDIINSFNFLNSNYPTADIAWDSWTEGGPYLWVWSRITEPDYIRTAAFQVIPSTGTLTGVSFEGVNMNPAGSPDGPLSAVISDQIIPGKIVFAGLQSSFYEISHDGLDWVVLYDLFSQESGVPGALISVSPDFLQNNLEHGDSLDVAIQVENLSEDVALNWQVSLEYPNPFPGSEAGDILLNIDASGLDLPTPGTSLQAVAYIDQHIYVSTYAGPGSSGHYLLKLTPDGQLISTDTIFESGSYGWSAITSDDQYIYAAREYLIVKYDPVLNETVEIYLNPNFFVSGLAYDPQNEHLYLGGSNGEVRKINKNGDILATYFTNYAISGLSWDNWSPGGPYLWAMHKTGGANGSTMAVRLNPSSGNPTGLSFEATSFGDNPELTDQPRDIIVTPNWQTNKLVMIAIQKSFNADESSTDHIVVYDLATTPPPGWITLMPPATGITEPLDTDIFYVRLNAIMEDTLTTAQIIINSNDINTPAKSIPVNFRMMPASTTILPGDANCDTLVNILDVIAVVRFIGGNNEEIFCLNNADLNGDGIINIMDVIGIVSIITGSDPDLIY